VHDFDRQARLWDLWAQHYDAEHQARDPEPAADFLAPLAGEGPALELAVGTGRIALPLADRGIPVTGLDASPAMIKELDRRRESRPVQAYLADIAELDTAGRQYPLIYIAFSSLYFLMTQPRQAACLTRVAQALAPGGHFVVEATIPRAPGLLAGRQQLAIRDLTDTSLRLSALTHDPIEQTIRFQELCFDEGGTRMLPVTLRYLHLSELDLLATAAGLTLAGRYADWQRTPLTSASTQHISLYTRTQDAP
jgi:SAM-dependent methyltransferase